MAPHSPWAVLRAWSRWVCVVYGGRSSRRLCSRGDPVSASQDWWPHRQPREDAPGQRRHSLCEEDAQKHRKSMERALFQHDLRPESVTALPKCSLPVTCHLSPVSPVPERHVAGIVRRLVLFRVALARLNVCRHRSFPLLHFWSTEAAIHLPAIANVHWIISTAGVINTAAKNIRARSGGHGVHCC